MARKPKAVQPAAAKDPVSGTVTVDCQAPGGLMLRVFTMLPDPDGGEPRAIPTAVTTLAFGTNPGVDAAFMQAWLDQNAASDAVQNGMITIQEEGNS